jgi:transcriptional regulator with XRE-family HTH domain
MGGENMLNVAKVRGRMAELNLGQKEVAAALGIAVSTASQKLNRVRPMDLDEAEVLAKLLQLEDSQFGEYFFA